MKKNIFLVCLIFCGAVIAFGAQAGVGDNVAGYAWSENIGWISFNCTNQLTCESIDYGVHINPADGTFSGQAWSENIGWISFERTETGNPPTEPYSALGLTYTAKADLDSGEVTGWARALSYGDGWDGWIKFNGDTYGVNISSAGEFFGYAWSDMVIGWIDMSENGVTADPSLFNKAPDKPVKVGAGEIWSHCSLKGKSIPIFSWIYSDPDGDLQAAYEIEVDNNAAFAAPKFNHLVNMPSTSYALDLSHDDDSDWLSDLAWNATYFWRVRVKDSNNAWSEWSSSDEFKTPFHAYPYPDFTWLPTEPIQGVAVIFDPDLSSSYGGVFISSYLWTVTQGGHEFINETDSSSQYPEIVFSSYENRVKLGVTDSDGYFCETSARDITAEIPLPEYRETSPVGFIKKSLAALVSFFQLLNCSF
jgi:hypothetical protein